MWRGRGRIQYQQSLEYWSDHCKRRDFDEYDRVAVQSGCYRLCQLQDGCRLSGCRHSVNFSTTLGALTPASGIATTDASGTATIQVTAGSNSGQGQITATATVDNKTVNLSQIFTVTLPPLKLANITLTSNTTGAIDLGSSQGISVDIQDANGNPFTSQSVEVTFTSTQAALGKASIASPVSSVNGRASTTYTSLSTPTNGTDVITASIAGASPITIPLTVNLLNAGSISYVSALPKTIGLKGMGGLGTQETSRVTFKVVDTSGAVKVNQPVDFSLNTTLGGLSLSATSGSTGADGTVSTIVQSGVIATPVRVTASTTVGATILSTQSDELVVSTGVPSQDGLSVAESDLNPEAWSTDGVNVTVTARLSDHFHNPVPDGTAVSFTTTGGSIQPSCITAKGTCSVIWTSQNPRPMQASGAQRDGRAVIFAYAIGEEAFVDLNGNGVADAGEFTDNSEAFRDDNENGVRNANEPYLDFNGDGVFNGPDGKYNGVLQGAAYLGSATKSKNVFSNTVLIMSSGEALISILDASLVPLASIGSPTSFFVNVTDINGNTMPSGTTIAVSAPFGTLTGQSSFTVPHNTGFGVTLPLNIAASSSPKFQTGLITIKVTSPAGLVTTAFLDISGIF